ncbi:MAG: cytidine deaminase [Defluviitaleaceae bacterium]|nr:cytidine deaminase [Defluviitaleaceae bacterium]
MIEQKMFNIAAELICKRYPKGEGGAAVVRTEDDMYFTGIWLDTINESVSICIETGAICEAHKHGSRVTHSLCLSREDENSPFEILTPCGVCQERLRFWGDGVMVGITTPDRVLKFLPLSVVQPHHWTGAIPAGEIEDYDYNQRNTTMKSI